MPDTPRGSAARGGPVTPNLRLICSHQHCNPVGGRTWWCADCGVEFEGLLLAEIDAEIKAEMETPDA